MSVRQAHDFIRAVRSDPRLGAATIAAAADDGIEALARLARSSGFEVEAADLRDAYRQDWALRSIANGLAAPAANFSASERASAE